MIGLKIREPSFHSPALARAHTPRAPRQSSLAPRHASFDSRRLDRPLWSRARRQPSTGTPTRAASAAAAPLHRDEASRPPAPPTQKGRRITSTADSAGCGYGHPRRRAFCRSPQTPPRQRRFRPAGGQSRAERGPSLHPPRAPRPRGGRGGRGARRSRRGSEPGCRRGRPAAEATAATRAPTSRGPRFLGRPRAAPSPSDTSDASRPGTQAARRRGRPRGKPWRRGGGGRGPRQAPASSPRRRARAARRRAPGPGAQRRRPSSLPPRRPKPRASETGTGAAGWPVRCGGRPAVASNRRGVSSHAPLKSLPEPRPPVSLCCGCRGCWPPGLNDPGEDARAGHASCFPA